MGARAVDPERALAPVTVLVTQPLMLVAHPSFPGSTFGDVIRMARERPETIAFSTSGIGGTAHLAGEWMMARAGIRLLHVPYAANRALTDVLSGEVPLAISFAGTVLPMVRMGQLKAIAVLSAERIAVAPEVPTLAEAGVPGIDVSLWQGLLAPSGTPSAIVQRIARDAAAFLATPDVRERLRAIGVDPAARGPDAMGAQIRQETARWKKVVADAGLTFN
jgi:tripartite-type tricarboxylate transporter receptor subunit TctC